MYTLSIEKTISASHQLRDYDGDCARLHGHNWKIKVEVAADKLNPVGMAIDFTDLEKLTWKIIGGFDHNNFNVISPFDNINPTAENIVKYIYQELAKILPKGIRLKKVSLWEMDNYIVEYEE
jgi:6-pyruvoyltetrahydropterin/6-carboxytetrahydropterin synthase